MNAQLCIAHHPDNPPSTLGGGFLLCAGHVAALTEALTGPSAAEDGTLDAVWGVRSGQWVAVYPGPKEAFGAAAKSNAALEEERQRHPAMRYLPYTVVCGDGITWCAPSEYRPGGLARDWSALSLRGKTLRTGEPGPVVTSSAEPGLPFDDRVADLRSQIVHDLSWWVREHVTHFGTTRPEARTVYQLTAWLAIWRDKAAAAPFAGEYVAVLSELRARVRRAVDLPHTRRELIGSCPEHHEGQRCPGQLWTCPREAGAPGLPAIACDTCGTTFDSTRWESLRNRLNRAA